MATRPTAARGKVTRKERFKRKANDILTRQGLNNADRLNDLRDTIENTMESFLSAGVGSMAGSALNRARQIKPSGRLSTDDLERASKKRGGKMSTGGEVDIDMTTEMDV